MNKPVLLHDEKVRLRAMEPEDLDLIYRIENMTDFWRMGTANVPYSRYAVRRFIAESQNDLFADGQVRLMIERRDSEQTVGCIDLTAFSALHRRAEVGILLLPEHQHQGLGRVALSLLCNYGQHFLQLHQLYAYVAEENVAACRLFQSAAFSRVASLPEWLGDGCGFRSACLFQLIFRS